MDLNITCQECGHKKPAYQLEKCMCRKYICDQCYTIYENYETHFDSTFWCSKCTPDVWCYDCGQDLPPKIYWRIPFPLCVTCKGKKKYEPKLIRWTDHIDDEGYNDIYRVCQKCNGDDEYYEHQPAYFDHLRMIVCTHCFEREVAALYDDKKYRLRVRRRKRRRKKN